MFERNDAWRGSGQAINLDGQARPKAHYLPIVTKLARLTVQAKVPHLPPQVDLVREGIFPVDLPTVLWFKGRPFNKARLAARAGLLATDTGVPGLHGAQ